MGAIDAVDADSHALPGTPGKYNAITDVARVKVGLNPRMVHDNLIGALHRDPIQPTEEAIINAMLGAETLVGADNLRVTALPHDQVRAILQRHNLLTK